MTGPTVAEVTYTIGDWMPSGHIQSSPPPHRSPGDTVHRPLYCTLYTIWADAERTTPLAVQDVDGCQALIISRPTFG